VGDDSAAARSTPFPWIQSGADTMSRIVCGASQPLCAHGNSSSLAAATLVDLRYARATDVIGGFEARAAAGLPVVPGDD
jgi:hypothetical protein